MLLLGFTISLLSAACTLQTAGAPKGPLTLTATFDDVHHLVAGHAVKVADVQVGSVRKIELDGYRGKVTISIVSGRKIPKGTTASVSQTSLLGENYVRLTFPETFDPANGPFLSTGDAIEKTTSDPETEQVTSQALDVLGAIQANDLSAVINAAATGLGGRGEQLRTLIDQLSDLGVTFAAQQDDLGRAIDGLGQLGDSLTQPGVDVGALIDQLSGATRSLSEQRLRLIAGLRSLGDLAGTLNDEVIEPHGRELDIMLAQLDPIVAMLAGQKTTLQSLLKNTAFLAEKAPSAVYGDQLLLYLYTPDILHDDGTTTPIPGSN